jgi:2,3-bisphosphoglycerate-independent phosphoglycerate mutase
MKCLLVVCDGIADRPLEELGGQTPLESAKTPNLDLLAKKGVCGIVDVIAPGIRPGSDTAHLAILGYDPISSYTGRGPFEAAGAGLDVRTGDVAFRCNFATVEKGGVVLDRRADRISSGTDRLSDAINEIEIPGVEFRFKETTGHRGALVMSGGDFSDNITESDPHKKGVKAREIDAKDDSASAHHTASSLNSFIEKSHKVLESHPVNLKRVADKKRPANFLLLRGAGVAPLLDPFEKKFGLRGGCIATVALVRGVGRFCGLDVLGADPSTGTEELINMALNALDRYDFILLNIKAADDASHDGDAQSKVKIIEEIDKAAERFHNLTNENYLALLSDHTSPVTRRDHSGDPVPILLAGPEVRTDKVSAFSEISAPSGGLSRIRGIDIMSLLVDLMNKSEKFGA